jgi:hypothetical protein
MTAIYDADNASNWIQVYNGSFAATYPQGQQIPVYNPIPKTELPIDIDRELVAVYCTSTQYPNSKKYLGSVYQAIVGNGAFPTAAATAKVRAIYSNSTTLIEFTQFDDIYRLILSPRWWIEQLNITVFKYTGLANFKLEERLSIIEGKIDQLL